MLSKKAGGLRKTRLETSDVLRRSWGKKDLEKETARSTAKEGGGRRSHPGKQRRRPMRGNPEEIRRSSEKRIFLKKK